jgi:hypothetical protein
MPGRFFIPGSRIDIYPGPIIAHSEFLPKGGGLEA